MDGEIRTQPNLAAHLVENAGLCYNKTKAVMALKRLRLIYGCLFCGILLTEILIALFVKDDFVRPYVGDVLVTVLICAFCRIFIPQKVVALPILVLLFAVAVEIGQYFDIVKLLNLENNRLLSTLIGRTFSTADILCYAIGCLLFFVIDRILCRNRAISV